MDVRRKQASEAVRVRYPASKILTGVPTPIKYHSREIRGAYTEIEQLACDKLLATLPEEMQPAYRSLLIGEEADALHDLVKAADKLSAYIKCIEERKTGNNEFLSAEKSTRTILEENPLPEVRYFLDLFIPAFELDLDELGTIGE